MKKTSYYRHESGKREKKQARPKMVNPAKWGDGGCSSDISSSHYFCQSKVSSMLYQGSGGGGGGRNIIFYEEEMSIRLYVMNWANKVNKCS